MSTVSTDLKPTLIMVAYYSMENQKSHENKMRKPPEMDITQLDELVLEYSFEHCEQLGARSLHH